jgi:hypothetical protein
MPDPFASKRIDQTVEAIGQRGCEYVRRVIDAIEVGKSIDVMEIREPDDIDRVLAELKEIMSVYDESEGSCCPVPGLISAATAGIKKASQ